MTGRPWDDAVLDAMRLSADPLADDTIAAIFAHGRPAVDAARTALDRLRANGDPVDWRGIPDEVRRPLEHFLRVSAEPPAWRDTALVEHAERFFYDHGLLSVLTLFGASLPACYVVPNLAQVLQVAGQLIDRTDHRVRETGRMIFPVMAPGGLTTPEGTGIPQVQRVRLIHATIRHDILHGNPAEAARALAEGGGWRVAPRGATPSGRCPMHQAMRDHGWDVGTDGLPINQEELAYTLLTFSWVALGALRALGVLVSPEDERAYLHCWNVVGHHLGIDRALMVDTMDDAARLSAAIQARGRRLPLPARGDPRPPLGRALTGAVERAIPLAPLRPVAVLMPRFLLGDATADVVGIDAHVGLLPRVAFRVGLVVVRIAERTLQLLDAEVSLVRLLHRVLAYHVLRDLLELETRPLELPDGLLHPLVESWASDARQPSWLRRLERRLTGPPLRPAARPAG